MTKISRIIILLLVSGSLLAAVFAGVAMFRKRNALPVLGEPGHTVGNFSFTNQNGKKISRDDVKNKITVVEYFFTTCPGICKIMSRNLETVYEFYKNDSNVTILSHTVDPETDSVSVLKAYADRMGADAPGWQFLTGDKAGLYNAARKNYLLAVEDNANTAIKDDFIHTQYVALVDTEQRIRGFYSATDSLDMKKLIGDIRKLQGE
ncbi:MAG: SCO family protein [Chitinophagaceae bacterium]|nr:MAG: SCO family protein [Chitinophagaceae bacterium]